MLSSMSAGQRRHCSCPEPACVKPRPTTLRSGKRREPGQPWRVRTMQHLSPAQFRQRHHGQQGVLEREKRQRQADAVRDQDQTRGAMHPEHRHPRARDTYFDDFLGVLVSRRDDDAVATREDLLCPAARKEGILNRERAARHQRLRARQDRGTNPRWRRYDGPTPAVAGSKGSLVDRVMAVTEIDATAGPSATTVPCPGGATGCCRSRPHRHTRAILPMQSATLPGGGSRTGVSTGGSRIG